MHYGAQLGTLIHIQLGVRLEVGVGSDGDTDASEDANQAIESLLRIVRQVVARFRAQGAAFQPVI